MNDLSTDWTLVSLSPFGPGLILGMAGLILIAALVVLASYRRAKKPALLVLTRVLGALLLIGFLTEPALQERLVRKIKNRLAVVVDRSRSMTLSAEGGGTRYDQALAFLTSSKKTLEELGEAHVIELFDLDGPLSQGGLEQPPQGERSDLVAALERVKDTSSGKPLAGIVLVSDGADNAALEDPNARTLSAAAKERLARLGVPVNTVYAGKGATFRDVGIVDVTHDEFAFVHNTFQIEVLLEGVGFAGMSVPVTLKRDGEVMAQQTVTLERDGRTTLLLSNKPDKIGEFVYSVSLPSLPGEAIHENNERSFVVSVIRDKIRVLQVAGQPSWDERFLRQHLKENPNVDLISFFILRTPTDMPGAPENELSLIPFPVDKLFTTELKSFDVVIFQNFDFRPYKMAQYLPNIREAVTEAGLGFAMIGGGQSFAGGGYGGSDLAPILPLLPETGALMSKATKPALTPAGLLHPITDLARGSGKNDAIWRALPPWASINSTGGLASNATALVIDPQTPGPGGHPMPLIAVMEAGQGRTMAIATDNLWRWRFSGGSDGGAAERAYHRFWSNALRWLVRDPEHSRVRVSADTRRVDRGSPADITVTVLGQDYQPIRDAQVRVTLIPVFGGNERLDDLTTGEGGTTKRRYPDLKEGAYRVTATASASGKVLGSDDAVFVVQAQSQELASGAPRPDLLGAIAERTRARAQDTSDGALSDIKLLDPDVVEVDRKRNIELWDNAWALTIGALLLAADWAIRRRRGYL